MTTSHDAGSHDADSAPVVPVESPAGVGGDSATARLLEGLARRLGGQASVSAVFGEPVTRDGVTVVPVARVGFGFGGGTGHSTGKDKSGEGGGGGGGADARPLGFIELADGAATYHPIRDPWADFVLPLAALLVGTAAPVLARALARRRKKR
ncbi:spore germination protein GerW family protein [Streptomyces sp. NPDC059785]|uniref:spore germination protein GerW family protein n=1 Tax=unclassified Streptomyces TaxID=2593676 RepID=UPI0036475B28